MYNLYLGLACLLLLSILLYEMYKSQKFTEGFESQSNQFLDSYYPKRSDIVPGQVKEPEGNLVRDLRYRADYIDVQHIGSKSDFCRVVLNPSDPGSMIMACALAGTDGSTSISYRTKSKAEGFVFSRDDYFKDLNEDGRDDYCRIIKVANAPNDSWASMCVLAELEHFSKAEIPDPKPPQDIADLLWFYEGIMVWYRFKDDLLDYAENTKLSTLGNMKIDEDPTRIITEGLQINPTFNLEKPPVADQYIRLGENSRMELEDKVNMKEFRAFSTWVKFDTFTNNARIFDFGNGAGSDNVFLGIEGKGNYNTVQEDIKPSSDNIVCNRSPTLEIRPQVYMKKTAANVDEYDCPGPEPIDKTTTEPEIKRRKDRTANLLFEIWDKKQRKMRVKVIDAIKENTWQHITVTTNDLSITPTWTVYIDGVNVFTKSDGFLPQTNYYTLNYIGRSNWEQASNQGEYKDERFRGSLFDFRMYRIPMPESKIQKTVEWGKMLLNPNSR